MAFRRLPHPICKRLLTGIEEYWTRPILGTHATRTKQYRLAGHTIVRQPAWTQGVPRLIGFSAGSSTPRAATAAIAGATPTRHPSLRHGDRLRHPRPPAHHAPRTTRPHTHCRRNLAKSVYPPRHVLDKDELMVYHHVQAAHSGTGAGLGSASPSPGPFSRHPGPESSPRSPRAPPLRWVAAQSLSQPRTAPRPAGRTAPDATSPLASADPTAGVRGSSPRGRLMRNASAARSGGSTIVFHRRTDRQPPRAPPPPHEVRGRLPLASRTGERGLGGEGTPG